MTGKPIRIVLIDDHQVLLDALAERINADPEIEVVGTATDATQGLDRVLETSPDVVVLDVQLPGRGAFDMATEMASRAKGVKIVFLTGYLSDVLLDQALRLKVRGYLLKWEPIGTLVNCIRKIAAGDVCYSKEVEERLVFDPQRKQYQLRSKAGTSALTGRQLEVLRYLAQGRSVKEVAKVMHLSEKSVDSHKYRIMNRLGIHDRVELARYAIREGLTLP